MGNSCTKNTIVEKNNIDDMYSPNKKIIHKWPELQSKSLSLAIHTLSQKGYKVETTKNSNFSNRSTYYNRVILYTEKGLVLNIPTVG